ncbi:hypothetical protein CCP3SC15_6120003 [Gammaproteobacteria bacterium]
MAEKQKFEIEGELLNAIVQTLSRLPYEEVAPIMKAIETGGVKPITEAPNP